MRKTGRSDMDNTKTWFVLTKLKTDSGGGYDLERSRISPLRTPKSTRIVVKMTRKDMTHTGFIVSIQKVFTISFWNVEVVVFLIRKFPERWNVLKVI